MSMDPVLRNKAVEAIKLAALQAFEGRVRAVLLKGSALRDDFIPEYSDLDVHIYIPSDLMQSSRAPRLEYAVRFQEAVGSLDPADYGVDSFQIYFIDAEHYPEDWSKPLEGTYELIYGAPVEDASTPEERLRRSREHLEACPSHIASLLGRFVDKPDTSLPNVVRLAGATLKGFVYSAVMVTASAPEIVARKSVQDLLKILGDGGVHTSPSEIFFSRMQDWSELKQDPGRCREAFRLAIRGMQNISEWYSSRQQGDS